MGYYLFIQDKEKFETSKDLEINSKDSYNINDRLLIITEEKLYDASILDIMDTQLITKDIKEIKLSSNDFKKYIIELLSQEKDKEKLNEKYHYLLEGKEGAISVLGYLEVIKKRTETFKIKLFRGHSSTSWTLQPSLYRGNYKIGRERELFRDIRKLNFKDFKEQDNFINTLCRMQHYGIPTTLLDWTKNPLTALFFSCLPPKGENAEIIYVDPKNYYLYDYEEFLIFNKLLSNQYDSSEKLDEDKMIEKILEIYRSKSNLYFIETIFENQRVTAQNGLFSFILNFDLAHKDNIKIMAKFREYILEKYNSDIKEKIYNKTSSNFPATQDDILKFLMELKNIKIHLSELFSLDRHLTHINTTKIYDTCKRELKDSLEFDKRTTDAILQELYLYFEKSLDDFQKLLSKKEIKVEDHPINSIIIPDEKRSEILKELDEIFNINFVTIYPDINGFSQYLKAKYN